MSNEQLHRRLLKRLHQEKAFWSYDVQKITSLSDDALISSVLLHLDIEDILVLFKLFPKKKIQKVWKEKMLIQEPMYHGLNRLYAWLFFGIKNPDRYIRDFKNKSFKLRLCRD